MSYSNYETIRTPFVVDKEKLRRIYEIFREQPWLDRGVSFEATLRDKTVFPGADLEELVSHDNLVGNPIQEVVIRARGRDGSASISANGSLAWITISIHAPSGDDYNILFTDLRQQVDRWKHSSRIHALKQSGFLALVAGPGLVLALLLGFLSLGVKVPAPTPSRTSGLTDTDIVELRKASADAKTSEQRTAFLVDVQTRWLDGLAEGREASQHSEYWWAKAPLKRIAFILGPIALIALLLTYLVAKCYPETVFDWGDMGLHYAGLKRQRAAIWGGVLLSLVVGVTGNLLVIGALGN